MRAVPSFTVVQGGTPRTVTRDEELYELISLIWEDIVLHIKDVLAGAAHGYEEILVLADPSIEEIVKSISKIDEFLNRLLDGVASGHIDPESAMRLVDCQQGLHLIRRVHIALQQDNQDEYNDVVRKLQCHASTFA